MRRRGTVRRGEKQRLQIRHDRIRYPLGVGMAVTPDGAVMPMANWQRIHFGLAMAQEEYWIEPDARAVDATVAVEHAPWVDDGEPSWHSWRRICDYHFGSEIGEDGRCVVGGEQPDFGWSVVDERGFVWYRAEKVTLCAARNLRSR